MSDQEMQAVLATLEPLGDRIWFAINVSQRECDFAGLRENGWSTGERALIDWAEALWSGHGKVDLGYIASGLDDRFLAAALAGLAAYRGKSLPLPAVTA